MEKKTIRRMGIWGILTAIFIFILSSYGLFFARRLILSEETLSKLKLMAPQYEEVISATMNASNILFKLAIFAFAESIILFVISVGFLKFKNWARLLSLGNYVFLTLVVVFTIFKYNPRDFVSAAIMLAIGIYLFYFFTRPKVKEQFRKEE